MNTPIGLDSLVEKFVTKQHTCKIQFGDKELLPCTYCEAKAAIQALVDRECNRVRIDALEIIDDKLYDITTVTWGDPTEESVKEWGKDHADLYVPTRDVHRTISDYHKELSDKENK